MTHLFSSSLFFNVECRKLSFDVFCRRCLGSWRSHLLLPTSRIDRKFYGRGEEHCRFSKTFDFILQEYVGVSNSNWLVKGQRNIIHIGKGQKAQSRKNLHQIDSQWQIWIKITQYTLNFNLKLYLVSFRDEQGPHEVWVLETPILEWYCILMRCSFLRLDFLCISFCVSKMNLFHLISDFRERWNRSLSFKFR